MKIGIFGTIILAIFFISCEKSGSRKAVDRPSIDYGNKTVLDSLIKATPQSKDTMFLGFMIGMSKSDYKNHIEKLRAEGKTIDYSNSNKFSTVAGIFDFGPGYTFRTNISTVRSGSTITGEGRYFLEPIYNGNAELAQLNILFIEKWNDSSYLIDEPNWLQEKIAKNSDRLKDNDLKKALVENKIINSRDFVRQKGNLIIYKNSLTVSYVDLKTILLEILLKEIEKEIIKDETEDIKF